MASVDERRRRCLDLRRSKLEDTKLLIEAMNSELQKASNSPLTSPQKVENDPSELLNSSNPEPGGIVISLPVSAARKSARKMIKDPLAITQGRKEANILARVDELQSLGTWTGKKIAKLQMPAKTKTHWDYVIEEMHWLSGVILQERKTKKVRLNWFDDEST